MAANQGATPGEIQCRFCFESESTPRNPLISPCECIGTVRYVHKGCLRQWAAMDPAANARICTICRTPFKLQVLPAFEVLPPERSWPCFFLRNMGYISLMAKYICFMTMIHHNTLGYAFYTNMRDTEAAALSAYILFAAYQVKVANLNLYFSQLERGYIPYIFTVACVALGSLLHREDSLMTVILDLCMNMAWHEHLLALRRVNAELRRL